MMTDLSPFSGSPDHVKVEQSPHQTSATTLPTAVPAPAAPAKPKNKPRKRVNTAEKRHQHNAVERQRRETLNGKFINLARLLPALANHRRPSKAAIVNGSIAHLTAQRDQRLLAARLLRSLCAERDVLAKECNEWRMANGIPLKEGGGQTGWTDEMEEVCAVENETFGTFANMQEDDGEDDEQENQDGASSSENGGNVPAQTQARGLVQKGFEMGIEQATAAVASFANNGLITPRNSTEIDPMSLALGLSASVHETHVQPQAHSMPLTWPSGFTFQNSVPTLNMAHSDPMSSSTGSLPFNAFMSDSLDTLSSSPSGSMHIPTPPTTNDFSRFTHTPSPRSSGSFEDASSGFLHMSQQQQQHFQPSQLHPAQNYLDQLRQTDRPHLTPQQQLVLMHQIQQQQLQQQHLAEMQKQSFSAPAPINIPSTGYGMNQPLHSSTNMPILGRMTAEEIDVLRKYSIPANGLPSGAGGIGGAVAGWMQSAVKGF